MRGLNKDGKRRREGDGRERERGWKGKEEEEEGAVNSESKEDRDGGRERANLVVRVVA